MVFSNYVKLRILFYNAKGFKPYTIEKLLQQHEGIVVSNWEVAKFLQTFNKTGCISRQPGSGRPSKITAAVKYLVEQQMQVDGETTATQLHQFLNSKGIDLSLATILRCRTALGWTFRGSAYCQLIRKEK